MKKECVGLFALGLLVLFALAHPLLAYQKDYHFILNQHFVEDTLEQHHAFSFFENVQRLYSRYQFKKNSLTYDYEKRSLNVNNPDEVFSYVFARIPSYAIVYPSEMYYYFLFDTENQTISGNLRLVEARNGRIGLGYFDADDQGFANAKKFGLAEGLLIEQKSDTVFKLTYQGKTVTFVLFDLSDEALEGIVLLPQEELVSPILDESGIFLFLLFNKETHSFYYVLNENRPATETFEQLAEYVYRGERSGFVYYYDEQLDRKVLFGVNSRNIRDNNYYDGPFDQVPPFLPIREKIYLAYPYTQFGEGINEHGVFIGRESTRVAISPYFEYYDDEHIRYWVEDCEEFLRDQSAYLSCLAYEPKKDYHLDSPLFYPNGTLKE